jgi:hypothetical protein
MIRLPRLNRPLTPSTSRALYQIIIIFAIGFSYLWGSVPLYARIYKLLDVPSGGGGAIFEYVGPPCGAADCKGWLKVDTDPQTWGIAAGGGFLYKLRNDGSIWGTACDPTGCRLWQLLDNDPLNCGLRRGGGTKPDCDWFDDGLEPSYNGRPPPTWPIIAGGQVLYKIREDHSIWRYKGPPCNGNICGGWEMLDNYQGTIGFYAGDRYLYQLRNDNTVWGYIEPPCDTTGACNGWVQLAQNPDRMWPKAGGTEIYQHAGFRTSHFFPPPSCGPGGCGGWEDLSKVMVNIWAGGVGLLGLQSDAPGWSFWARKAWRYRGPPCDTTGCNGWELLDENSQEKERPSPYLIETIFADDTDIYEELEIDILHDNPPFDNTYSHSIRRYLSPPSPNRWEDIDRPQVGYWPAVDK